MIKIIFIFNVFLAGVFCQPPSAELDGFNPVLRGQLREIFQNAEMNGLPLDPLRHKIREGIAKGKSGEEIVKALRFRYESMIQVDSRVRQGHGGDFYKSLYQMEAEGTRNIEAPTAVRPAPEIADAPKKRRKAKVRDRKKGNASPGKSRVKQRQGHGNKEQNHDTPLEKKQRSLERKSQKMEALLEKKQEMIEKKLEKKLKDLEKRKSKK
ncbi:hypothetical protein ACFL5V_11025 [Fibrobacterota bacterium]